MAETTAEVRRDIEQTRERMSSTIAQLEQKLNVVRVVRDHPWPALALAFGAGVALSASGTDRKAAAATLAVTRGSSSKIGSALDDIVASLMNGVHAALQDRVDSWVDELKGAIGTSATLRTRGGGGVGARTVATSGGYGTGPMANDITLPGSLQRAD